MFNLGIAFIIVLLTVITVSVVSLCKSEINQKWLQVSSQFKALFPYVEKEASARRNLQKTRRDYIKQRLNQREHFNREMSGLDKLLEDSLIDKDTHSRYKKLLEMGYEQNRQKTRKRYGLTKTSLT